MDSTQALKEALKLLRNDKPKSARTILIKLVKQDPNLEQAWHMLAFAVADPDKQIQALEKVLTLNPDNRKAQAQLEQVRQGQPLQISKNKSKKQPSKTTSSNSRKWVLVSLAALLGLIFLIICGGLLFLNRGRFLGQSGEAIAQSSPPQQDLAAESAPEQASPTVTPTLTASAVYTPIFTSLNCDFMDIYSLDNSVVECGYVSVPEDRQGDLADTIQLAVVIYHSRSSKPASDPVIFLQGGPGYGAINEFGDTSFDSLLEERDVIVVDQRGTGQSIPALTCWEADAFYHNNQDVSLSSPNGTAKIVDSLKSCYDRLSRNGINLANYTTTNSAADIKDVAVALGYEQVNLYGASYGTRLAQAIMRDHPDFVRSAILDSPLPLQVKFYNETTAQLGMALETMFADCQTDRRCQVAYPDLETVFYDLLRQLEAEPVIVETSNYLTDETEEHPATNITLVELVKRSMCCGGYIIPEKIYLIQQGDYSPMESYVGNMDGLDKDLSLGLKLSIDCHEQVLASTPDEMKADLARYPEFVSWAEAAMFGSVDTLFTICDVWDVGAFEPDQSQPLNSNIPTLLISGQHDPITPPEYGRLLNTQLTHSTYIELPRRGHTPSFNLSGSCPSEIIVSFLSDPSLPPDKKCLEKLGTPAFIVPVEEVKLETFTDNTLGITGLAPVNWSYNGEGFYTRNPDYPEDYASLGLFQNDMTPDEWLTFLEESYKTDQTPYEAEIYRANGLTWKLYNATISSDDQQYYIFDVALAETGHQTLMVSLVSQYQERSQLYNDLYLPAIEALTPINWNPDTVVAVDSDGLISGACSFVSEEQLTPGTEELDMSMTAYTYAGPADNPLPVKSMAILTVIGASEPPETVDIRGKAYTKSTDDSMMESIPIDPAILGLDDQTSIPVVSLMLVSIEPDVEDPITLTLDGKAYPLQLTNPLGGFALLYGLYTSDESLKARCQYHSLSSYEVEAINAME